MTVSHGHMAVLCYSGAIAHLLHARGSKTCGRRQELCVLVRLTYFILKKSNLNIFYMPNINMTKCYFYTENLKNWMFLPWNFVMLPMQGSLPCNLSVSQTALGQWVICHLGLVKKMIHILLGMLLFLFYPCEYRKTIFNVHVC